jgi:hypothetical protein
MKMRNNLPETMGHSKGILKREVYNHECPHQKIRDTSNKPCDNVPLTQNLKINSILKAVD